MAQYRLAEIGGDLHRHSVLLLLAEAKNFEKAKIVNRGLIEHVKRLLTQDAFGSLRLGLPETWPNVLNQIRDAQRHLDGNKHDAFVGELNLAHELNQQAQLSLHRPIFEFELMFAQLWLLP